MKVKCNMCEWKGEEEDLIIGKDPDKEICPNCHRIGYIMDLEGDNNG